MSKQESSRILEKVYSAKDNDSLVEAYNEWAENYDEHVTSFGYKMPAVTAALFGRYVNGEDGLMLDAGAGTGIMGEILYLAGYANWVGIDMTPGMLKIAEARKIYKSLREMTLGEKLDFADNEFAACQSIGVFTAGHAPASAFDELVRVVKKDGCIFFSLMDDIYESNGYKAKFDELEEAGKWKFVEKTQRFPGLPLEDPNSFHRIFVFRVC